jgi:hypothetical protein
MKFDALYNQIFVTEADKEIETKVAMPEDVDVEPLPLPEPSEAPVEGDETGMAPSTSVSGGGTLSDYLTKVQDFAKVLIDQDGDCLNKLIKQLDRPATPYEGIAGKITSDLVRVVEGLRSIETNLANYVIASKTGAA